MLQIDRDPTHPPARRTGADPVLLAQLGRRLALGRLAPGAVHEINNPLFAVLGLLEFLLAEADAGSKAHERLLLAQESALEIKAIAQALLRYARTPCDRVEEVDVRDVARSAVELVRLTSSAKGADLVASYGDEPAPVRCSPAQLELVVLELVVNAQQACRDGGTVAVEARREEDAAVVAVVDDGPGIDPAELRRVFDAFFTTRRSAGGTGLGLSIAAALADFHGGELLAGPEPGRGARFELRLPLLEEAA